MLVLNHVDAAVLGLCNFSLFKHVAEDASSSFVLRLVL
jgi:hypothetical protein